MADVLFTPRRIRRTWSFRFAHSANQLSIYGAVSSWCEELAQWILGQNDLTVEKSAAKENEQLLKKCEAARSKFFGANSKSNDGTSGNRLRRYGTLKKKIKFSRVCEDAAFVRRVSVGMSHKTIDVDDCFGDRTSACRVFTLPREDPNSRIYATIPGKTSIGQVLQVHTARYLDISGIEIQIPSTTRNDPKTWV